MSATETVVPAPVGTMALGGDALTTSQYLAHAATAAYKDDPRQYQHYAALGFKRMEPFEAGNTRGYVGTTGRDVVLSFRGTDDMMDWIANIDFTQVEALGGRVHRGFFNTLQGVWKPVVQRLDALYDKNAKPRLWIAGHSLGGALAVLASKMIAPVLPIAGTYTFGQPRVGDENFAKGYGTQLIRSVTLKDAVPQVLLGDLTNWYRHVGTEEWQFDHTSAWKKAPGIESFIGGFLTLANNLPWGGSFDVATVQKHFQSVLSEHNMTTYLERIVANLKRPKVE